MEIPDLNGSEKELEELLSEPYPQTVEMMKRLEGDLMILGVGGKIGPSLAGTAAKACQQADVSKRIIGVDKVFTPALEKRLRNNNVELLTCDLSEYEQAKQLPAVENVIFMAGRKFGEVGSEPLTWLMNAVVPGVVGQVLTSSRIVVFSTGCVYELVSSDSLGSLEADVPRPVGEYANSCLGRERIFEYYGQLHNSPVLLFRLNYSVDLRYGVVVEIARDVYEGRPVDLTVNAVNFIWQGDVVNRALLSLELAEVPAAKLNVTGERVFPVRELALRFAEVFDKQVDFTGKDSEKAYLSDASKSFEVFGPVQVKERDLIQMVANWIQAGGARLDKPTHFSVIDGEFLDEKT